MKTQGDATALTLQPRTGVRVNGVDMKLKMAENSIFAILLRKPWWVSLLVVAVFVLLSGALLPAQYVMFGVMGAFPFVVIAVMAAWRQRNKPSAALAAQTLAAAGQMAWREFSERLVAGFKRQGYTVQPLGGKGADFVLTQAGRSTVVSCKRWKAATHGVDAVRELMNVQEAQGAQNALYVALGGVSGAASQLAKAEGVRLMSSDELVQLLVVK